MSDMSKVANSDSQIHLSLPVLLHLDEPDLESRSILLSNAKKRDKKKSSPGASSCQRYLNSPRAPLTDPVPCKRTKCGAENTVIQTRVTGLHVNTNMASDKKGTSALISPPS
jgi:hypothetical protein